MPAERIADIRQDYLKAALDEASAGNDPLLFFHQWFSEAQAAGITEVNAMTLATVNADGRPHARIVLLKGLDETGFVFFTNYLSAKGHDLAQSPRAALVFFWKELERQVRIEGRAEKVTSEESDAYFNSRPEGSRLGAWASPQSQVIESRIIVEENLTKYSKQFNGATIPRPEYWGGYRIVPQLVEFWQGRSSRLHDRIVFEHEEGGWKKCRLAP